MAKGRPKATGRFETRKELEEKVEYLYRNTTCSLALISANTGVSTGAIASIIKEVDIHYGKTTR